jgi:carbamoyl-phosphate synthase small subunit
MTTAHLVLADGSVFVGRAIGAEVPEGVSTGEVVFNTTLTGYQEVLSDPSYKGQIITFTATQIGNYGVTPSDDESERPHCQGVVVRELARRPSSWRAAEALEPWLARHGVPGITEIDTRRLTRIIRDKGAMPAAFGTADVATLHAAAASAVGTDGCDLAGGVSCSAPYQFVPDQRDAGMLPAALTQTTKNIVAFDFGMKRTILRQLSALGNVNVVPAQMTATDVLAMNADGVFLSNGPGDPAAVGYAIDTIRELLGKTPIFGICLGHQLLASALGGTTYKLPFGHHGGNHPVKDLTTDVVEITSQNHNYCVDIASLDGIAEITHINLNDGTVEGIACRDVPAFSVQYHPEAGPGPHDSRYLFKRFADLIEGRA